MNDGLEEERALTLRLKEWNCKRLQNQMVLFKRTRAQNQQTCTFVDYVAENMPENIKLAEDGSLLWLDDRLSGDNWKGTFEQVIADQELHVVGEMPQLGCEDNGGRGLRRSRRTPSSLADDVSIDSINSRFAELVALGWLDGSDGGGGGRGAGPRGRGVDGAGSARAGGADEEQRKARRRRRRKERREREQQQQEQRRQQQASQQREDPAVEARPSSDPKNRSEESGLADTAGDAAAVLSAMATPEKRASAGTGAGSEPCAACLQQAMGAMRDEGERAGGAGAAATTRRCSCRAMAAPCAAVAAAEGSAASCRADPPALPAAAFAGTPPRHGGATRKHGPQFAASGGDRAVVTLSSPQRADLLAEKLRMGRITELEYSALLAADRRAAAMDAEHQR